jgi:hypothetical protein
MAPGRTVPPGLSLRRGRPGMGSRPGKGGAI